VAQYGTGCTLIINCWSELNVASGYRLGDEEEANDLLEILDVLSVSSA